MTIFLFLLPVILLIALGLGCFAAYEIGLHRGYMAAMDEVIEELSKPENKIRGVISIPGNYRVYRKYLKETDQ